MKTDATPPRGTRDLLPDEVAARDHVSSTVADIYHRFGYQRIETPCVEDLERLTGGQGGENAKLIFAIMKRGLTDPLAGETALKDIADLGLRFDLTVPLTRYYAHNHANLPMPFRAFQLGPVWRAERPQQGRYRQFHQCDIDIIGMPGVLAEIELIEATSQALHAVGLSGTTVRLSDRRILSALAHHARLPEQSWDGFFISLDKLDKIGWDGVGRELVDKRGLAPEAVAQALETVQGLHAVEADKSIDALGTALPELPDSVLNDLASTTGALGDIGGLSWVFDPTLARGMGYYTGQVFEVEHPDSPGSLAGGGRYDRLVGRSLGKDVPACGFSLGFERIVNLLGTRRREAVAVLLDAEVSESRALHLMRALRAEGRTAASVPRSGKFAAQLARLEAWGYTSFMHLRADDTTPSSRPEERPLGSPPQT
ncbi:histidyl-tRNA synthetase [Murinocardiopsis flavida]|uniref:Histidine--tRNA ligase n=1 Tax=Murinocardiopsis flavida TaxID=645275 RepID=A0A2P8DG43_9ACTN|nr:histidine--tRNA ligase [Murinocardiopsis flavida]PSK96182.1 histidyl-tRNA synthetase [Murinocardiopsis flavida]